MTVLVERGAHVCWVVENDTDYLATARQILSEGRAVGEKLVAFGPEGDVLHSLAPFVEVATNPHSAFLDGGPVDPQRMFSMFSEQISLARAEGYEGVRVVADMDWLVPAQPSIDTVLAFESQLDHVVRDVGATVVCAYRRRSFDADAITGELCAHPIGLGGSAPFRLVAADAGVWALSGEIDLSCAGTFQRAFTTAASTDTCVIDASGLEFIDVAGARSLALTAVQTGRRIVVRNAPPVLRRIWEVAGFDEAAWSVELA